VSILHGLTNIPQSYFSFFTLAGVYLSLKYLSLSDATALTFLAPIITGFSGAIFLKEGLSFRNMLSGCRQCIRHTCPSCY
jgi:drug/metabolite transporter (DMT)-like permease